VDPKGKDRKPQEPAEKNIQTMKFLQESGLAKHPMIGRLLNHAMATGDFRELDHYLEINRSRLEAIMRMLQLQEFRKQQNPYYPPPAGDELVSLQGPLKIGIINERSGQPVWFEVHPWMLTMHEMILGRTGSGKTMFNMHFLMEAVRHGGDFNVLIPDVKITYRRLVGTVPGINVVTFDRFVFNPLEVPTWMDPRDFVFLFAKVFVADNVLSIPSENLLADALRILFTSRGIFDGGTNYPTMADLLGVVMKMQADKAMGYRYKDIFESNVNRLKPYVFCGRNFSARKGLSVDVFVQKNIVLELPLIKISNYIHNFTVSWLANLLYARNTILGLRGTKLRTLFLVDEARTLLGSNRESGGIDFIEPGINPIIAMGREFGLGLWLCSQETGSFSQIFRSNSLLKIAFPLTDGEDVNEIKRSFGLSDEQVAHFYKLPVQRVAVCRYGNFERPFLIVAPEVTGLDRVPDDREIEAAMAEFYAEVMPKEEPASAITDKTGPTPSYESPAAIDGLIMIKHLLKQPFLNYRELINELDLTPARGDQARAWLANSGFVTIHSIVLRRGKPGEYFELTEPAYRKFGGQPPAGKGSFEHKAFCHLIKAYIEDQEFGARVEGIMDGSAKPIDVLAWKKGVGMLGYEVTLHFSNLLRNLAEDLNTSLKTVIIVCRNKDELAKAEKIVRESSLPTDRVEFKTIFDFTQK
jgi:hypothetical protein